MASCSATSATLLSSTPKALSSTNPISQTLPIPKSFNGLRKPLKSQPSRSISLTSRSHSRRTTSFVVKASVSVCHFFKSIFLYILFVNYALRFVLDSFNFFGVRNVQCLHAKNLLHWMTIALWRILNLNKLLIFCSSTGKFQGFDIITRVLFS